LQHVAVLILRVLLLALDANSPPGVWHLVRALLATRHGHSG
jgi:hypothetical protein